jgi:hypothetical protein
MNSATNFGHCLPGILSDATLAISTFSTSATRNELLFKLSDDAEVPPDATMASGTGAITVNPDMTVSGKVMTSAVAATMAHIHVGKAGGERRGRRHPGAERRQHLAGTGRVRFERSRVSIPQGWRSPRE